MHEEDAEEIQVVVNRDRIADVLWPRHLPGSSSPPQKGGPVIRHWLVMVAAIVASTVAGVLVIYRPLGRPVEHCRHDAAHVGRRTGRVNTDGTPTPADHRWAATRGGDVGRPPTSPPRPGSRETSPPRLGSRETSPPGQLHLDRSSVEVVRGEGEAVEAGVVGVFVLDVDRHVRVDLGECAEELASSSRRRARSRPRRISTRGFPARRCTRTRSRWGPCPRRRRGPGWNEVSSTPRMSTPGVIMASFAAAWNTSGPEPRMQATTSMPCHIRCEGSISAPTLVAPVSVDQLASG